MPEHTLRRFDDALAALHEKVASMGALVEKAIAQAIDAIYQRDEKLARKVVERDRAVNAIEVETDELARRIIALWQPAAGDLRFIFSAVKVVTDLERIGDLAEGIADQWLHTDTHPKPPASLRALAEQAMREVREAVDAFTRRDVDKAMRAIEQDAELDQMFRSFQREMLTYMMEDPRKISEGLALFSIARALERIGDHATNIAEMAIYMVRGHDIRHVDHEEAERMLQENNKR
ncbi:MAG: phosphate transport system regulatory protein PhoU [Zetaproteobacteria bacterium]|nr:MAG: phosphate transport system regulatory protein PhoU [Zetaproteobacteria bacterium]